MVPRPAELPLLGATAGQGVVWYTGQFYALFFLTITLKLNYVLAYVLIGVSLIIATPFGMESMASFSVVSA